jgi:tetratricopeptide (TPR) repeat protein
MASAKLALGDEAAAISGFRLAYAEAPDFPPARAVLATAQLLDGERLGAFDTAIKALSEDATCEQAALIALQAAPAATTNLELEALLPASLVAKPMVLVVLASRARLRGEIEEALRYAEAAYGRDPENWRTCGLLAELLLAPILEDEALPLTRAVPAGSRETFRRGLKLLRVAWSKVKDNDHARHALNIGNNLLATLDLEGLEAECEQLVAEVLRVDPLFAPVLRWQTVNLASRSEWESALAVLKRLRPEDRDDRDRIVEGRCKLGLGERKEARVIAEEVRARSEPGRLRQSAAALALESLIASGGTADEVTTFLDSEPASMLVRVVAARFARSDAKVGAGLIADVDRMIATSDQIRDHVMGAEILAELGEYSRAADLLAPVTNAAAGTFLVRTRLRVLLLADRRKEARIIFEALPANTKRLDG